MGSSSSSSAGSQSDHDDLDSRLTDKAQSAGASDNLSEIQRRAQSGVSVIHSNVNLVGDLYGTLEESEDLKSRHRSLELVLVNGTTKPIRFHSEYFAHGTWFTQPNKLVTQPGSASVSFIATTGDWYGVAGGMRYIIEGTGKYLIIGFTNPDSGCYKTFIQCTSDAHLKAKHGYNHSFDDKVKFKREEGYTLAALIGEAKKGAMKLMEFIISE